MQTSTLHDAVACVPNGARLMIGGFMGVGTPEGLVDELLRQGKHDLTVIANDTAMRVWASANSLARAPCAR